MSRRSPGQDAGTSGAAAGARARSGRSGGSGVKGNDATARSKLRPGLYIVATPIGNLSDITLRALEILRAAHVIACEDTRVTARLLHRHGIATPLVAYHEHNAAQMRPKLLARLAEGEAVALVSDAGTPLVSDPGYKLVREAVAAGHMVTAAPGPSAVLAALVLSGLPSDRFLCAGFLPARKSARRAALAELAGIRATLVVFESARRLESTLADMAEIMGPRPAAVARELTKLFEEVRRGPLPELARHYRLHGPPKGEVVVVVGPPVAAQAQAGEEPAAAHEIDRRLIAATERASLRDAAREVASALGLPRRAVYARALRLAERKAP